MSKFCPNCGHELIDAAKFCKNCGYNLESGEKKSQSYEIPVVEKSHTLGIVLGYVFSLLIPLIGIIIGIYLQTRDDSPKASRHGKYVIIVGVVVWILSALTLFG